MFIYLLVYLPSITGLSRKSMLYILLLWIVLSRIVRLVCVCACMHVVCVCVFVYVHRCVHMYLNSQIFSKCTHAFVCLWVHAFLLVNWLSWLMALLSVVTEKADWYAWCCIFRKQKELGFGRTRNPEILIKNEQDGCYEHLFVGCLFSYPFWSWVMGLFHVSSFSVIRPAFWL